MARLLSTQSVETLKVLLDKLSRLEGGELDIDAFNQWFTNLRWDSSSGFNNDDLAPLGWAIETAIFEIEDYPEVFDDSRIMEVVYRVLDREGYMPLGETLRRSVRRFSVSIAAETIPLQQRSLLLTPFRIPPFRDGQLETIDLIA